MDKKFERLSQKDVVYLESGNILISHQTFKVEEFMNQIKHQLSLHGEIKEKWLGDGLICEILQPGTSGWQKGKIRISLEFCPEKPESSLADINLQVD